MSDRAKAASTAQRSLRRRRRRLRRAWVRRWLPTRWVFSVGVALWLILFISMQRGGGGVFASVFMLVYFFILVSGSITGAVMLGLDVREDHQRGLGDALVVLAASFASVVVSFAVIYYQMGGDGNFDGVEPSAGLTKVDAVYFALGTLSTAGTGALSAHSTLCRIAVSVQMVLDLALTGFAVAIVVSRLAQWRRRPSPRRRI